MENAENVGEAAGMAEKSAVRKANCLSKISELINFLSKSLKIYFINK